MNERCELGLEGRLLSVDSRKVPLYRFDVLVVGGGAAGAAAAWAAAEAGGEVALVAKSELAVLETWGAPRKPCALPKGRHSEIIAARAMLRRSVEVTRAVKEGRGDTSRSLR